MDRLVHSFQHFLEDPPSIPPQLQDVSTLKLISTLLAVFIALYVSSRALVKGEDESPISINVSVPDEAKPGWKGAVIDEPKIKVSRMLHACPVRIDTNLPSRNLD